MKRFAWCGAVLVGLLSGAVAAEEFPIRWTDLSESSGVRAATDGMMGHGGAWGDADGDGDLDLFIGGFCDRPNKEYTPAAGPVPAALLLNQGDGKFKLATDSPVVHFGRTSGALFVDLDNDGHSELYAANNAKGGTKLTAEPQRTAQTKHSLLFRGLGAKGLEDITAASAACPERLLTARNIGALDYDADGWLDLFVVEDKFTKNPRCALFRNLGGLKFEDVTAAAGLPENIFGLGLVVADFNDDGGADIFVGHSNRMFLASGKGKFAEQKNAIPAWVPLNGEDWPCGAAAADLNRDGRLDLVVSLHHARARNKLYLNRGVKNGEPVFEDVTIQAGWPEYVPNKCPHVEIQDFDNDGWPDVLLSAAWLDDEGRVTPLVMRHTGLKEGIPQFQPPRPIDGSTMVYYPAGPSADFDRDGDIDLCLINWFQGNHTRLLRNDGAAKNWLDVRVRGRQMNRMGLGSRVEVYAAGGLGKVDKLLGAQDMTIGYGYASGQDAVCHFGLGDIAKVDVRVKLPSGEVIDEKAVAAGQVLEVAEPASK